MRLTGNCFAVSQTGYSDTKLLLICLLLPAYAGEEEDIQETLMEEPFGGYHPERGEPSSGRTNAEGND